MAVKKKTKSVKKPAKKKTRTFAPSKRAKKKATVKKKTAKKSSKKQVKKTVKKSTRKKTNIRKAVSKKIEKTPNLKKRKSALKKEVLQTFSYLNELEQELERILEKNRQVSIKGSEGFEYCFEENCDQPSTTGGYCRYHYMVSWGYLKKRNKILSENKLKSWTVELMQNHSPRILDYMVRDLSNEKDFAIALSEMKLFKKPVVY